MTLWSSVNWQLQLVPLHSCSRNKGFFQTNWRIEGQDSSVSQQNNGDSFLGVTRYNPYWFLQKKGIINDKYDAISLGRFNDDLMKKLPQLAKRNMLFPKAKLIELIEIAPPFAIFPDLASNEYFLFYEYSYYYYYSIFEKAQRNEMTSTNLIIWNG